MPARSMASWASKRFSTRRETPRPVAGVASVAAPEVVVELDAVGVDAARSTGGEDSAGGVMTVSMLGEPAAPWPDMRLVSIPGTRGADITVSAPAASKDGVVDPEGAVVVARIVGSWICGGPAAGTVFPEVAARLVEEATGESV